MALIKCHECGNDISTEAASCPQCGAKPKPIPTKPAIWKKIFLGTIVLLGFIAWVESATNSTGKSSDAEPKKEPPVDFSRPLVTGQRTLICPADVSLDRREGHGIKEALDAHLSMFGHDEAVQKSGCQEWREGIPVSLDDEARKQATEFQSQHMCGMVDFDGGMIFSCDLKNVGPPNSTTPTAGAPISPNESSKSNVTSNADTFTNDQGAKKAIDDFAQSKGITVDQLDRRVGMKNNDLMAWVAALMKAPDASSDAIYERLGFVSNIETLNTPEDAKTPENSLDQKIDADPEFSITATELTNAYQQNISDADARFKGHRFLISGNLVENIINIPGNPPRINFFFGFLHGGAFQGKEEIWAPLQSRSKYGLGASDKERFAQLKKGEAVSLLCTGAGVAKGGIGGGALEDCTHVTKK
jgi:hypothetical protein